MRVSLIILLVACGGTSAEIAPTTAPTVTPVARRPTYRVMPGELGDKDVLARMPHHARIVREGHAWLRLDDNPLMEQPWNRAMDPPLVVPVIGETKDRVRIARETDKSRVALWIDRADLATTVVEATALDPGVTLEPGVDIELVGEDGQGGPRAAMLDVRVRDRGLRVHGSVKTAVLGTVWIGPEPKPASEFAEWGILAGRAIHAAPREDAPVIAETTDLIGATPGAVHGGWREVDVHRKGIRVHGFVPVGDVMEATVWLGEGEYRLGSRSVSVTHTDSLDVPAGACIYDREAGEIIGVTLEARTRSGAHQDEWDVVYIGTEWGSVVGRLHDLAGASGGSAAPRWESCLE